MLLSLALLKIAIEHTKDAYQKRSSSGLKAALTLAYTKGK
jgi:hypothetical protein